jgi:hypothetical protein
MNFTKRIDAPAELRGGKYREITSTVGNRIVTPKNLIAKKKL